MIIKIDDNCSILFGNASSFPIWHKDPAFKDFCNMLREQLSLNALVLDRQVHGTAGRIIESASSPTMIFETEGDWLMTSTPGVGIGVLVADCLPIVFYEPQSKLVAVAHAGWKGSVQSIAPVVLKKFAERTSNKPKIFFGPSGRSCCYEVKDDFVKQVENVAHAKECIIQRNNKLFFDNTRFNTLQLQDMGVNPDQIDTTHNLCTICNHQFHSYRRATDKTMYNTQGTVVWLRH